MDTPVGSPARARVDRTASRLEDALLDEFDDDDESDVDYAPLGNLDSDVDFSADSGDEEDEDGDGDVTRDTVDREDISDSDTDVSLEEEDFGALAEEALRTPPRARRKPGGQSTTSAGVTVSGMTTSVDPFGGGGRSGRGVNLTSMVSAALASADSRGGGSPATRAAGAAVDMMLEGGFLDDDDDEEVLMNAIARRTRARTGAIEDRVLEELELALPEDEPEFDWLDEVAEYDRFLETLNDASAGVRDLVGGGDAGVTADGDDDDDDDDYAEENPAAAAYEYRLREERRAAARQGGTSAPASVLRRSERVATERVNKGIRWKKRKTNAEMDMQKERALQLALAAMSFEPAQLTRLNQQIHQHTQLLFQSYCLSIVDPLQKETAQVTHALITTLQRAASMQFHRAHALKRTPHAAKLFAVALDDENAAWYGTVPRKDVYTVFDCAPLRCAYDFVCALTAVGPQPQPSVWRNPPQMYDLVTQQSTVKKLMVYQRNSPEFVRADDLFRAEPKSWENVLELYKKIHTELRKKAKLHAFFSASFKTWLPVPRAVYEVTREFSSRVSPDPTLLVGGRPLVEQLSTDFTNAEDWLIVVGIRHYGNDFERIAKQLLVTSDGKTIRRRAKALREQKRYDRERVARALRAAYNHALRPLDENEIDIIQRSFRELNEPARSYRANFSFALWCKVCARLKDRVPKCAWTLWRQYSLHGSSARGAAISGRINTQSNAEAVTRPPRARDDDDDIDREDVSDSDSEPVEPPTYDRDELSDSEDAPDARANRPLSKRAPSSTAFTEVEDAAIIAARAFNEPWESLLRPGAPCAGRSYDAIIHRFNVLKSRRAR